MVTAEVVWLKMSCLSYLSPIRCHQLQSEVRLTYATLPMDTQTTSNSAAVGLPYVRMATLSNDIIMETARSGTTIKNNKFQLWERELLESAEVRRKSTVAQLCTWSHP